MRLKDWKVVEKSLLDKNLLNKDKLATFIREFREIKKRVSILSYEQLQLLIHGRFDEAKDMILLSLAKTYVYFKDFIVEVLRSKYLVFDKFLNESDYNRFFNSKVLSHTELHGLSESTSKKVKQRMFTILEQIGLINEIPNRIIIKPFLSKNALNAILKDDPSYLTIFLYSNEEIKGFLQKMNYAHKSPL